MSLDVLLHPDACWRLTLYPDAGEAGGSFRSSIRRATPPPPRRVQDGPNRPDFIPEPDVLRSQQSAAARARGKIRRYAAANGLDRLGTLTYATANFDALAVRRDAGDFFKALRAAQGGQPMPYLWVPERHKSDAFHLHFAVGSFIPRKVIESSWGRGFVHIKRLQPAGGFDNSLDGSRIAARYLSKYVAKTFENDMAGLHRYEVAQGFQPRSLTYEGATDGEVIGWAVDVMGREPQTLWRSGDNEDWQGPPARWLQW